MTRLRLILGLLTLWTTALIAQYGNAPLGKYPPGYSGKTFRGLAGPADASGAIRIVDVDSNFRMHEFVGKFDKPCSVPNPKELLHLPTGTFVTVFFNPKTQQVAGQNVTENRIIGLVIGSWNGEAIPKDKQVFISCSGN